GPSGAECSDDRVAPAVSETPSGVASSVTSDAPEASEPTDPLEPELPAPGTGVPVTVLVGCPSGSTYTVSGGMTIVPPRIEVHSPSLSDPVCHRSAAPAPSPATKIGRAHV